jgi:hypothetical protein
MGSRQATWIVGAAAAAAAVAVVTTDRSGSEGQSVRGAGLSGRSLSVPTSGRPTGGCPVTRPRWRPARAEQEGRLWVAFGPTGGTYRVPAENVAPDGSLGIKLGWQRGPGVRGRVRVEVRRLDQRAPALRRLISTRGYGFTGLQASGLALPSEGCWRVSASAGRAGLTFVLLVRAAASEPVAPQNQPSGVVVDCARRSEARFPGAFTDSRNLVVGPLVLTGGGEPTSAGVVRDFGGNKFPLLVKAGHTVTVRLAGRARNFAGLAYGGLGHGPLPQGVQLRLRDAAHTMTFIACHRGRPTRRWLSEGPSASRADGEAVTFWSGFVIARRPGCVPLEIYVDAERSPRRAVIDMDGGRCAT